MMNGYRQLCGYLYSVRKSIRYNDPVNEYPKVMPIQEEKKKTDSNKT